jgi:hypothetical protein
MAQHGRKSAASLEITSLRLASGKPKPVPPSTLTPQEKATFCQVLARNPHLDADDPLVALYVLTLTKASKLSRGKHVGDFEKAARLAVTIATKLRITAQSSYNPISVGRAKADNTSHRQKPWLDDGDASEEHNDDVEE